MRHVCAEKGVGPVKGRLFLVHWKSAEAEAYGEALRGQGWDVVGVESSDGARAYRSIQADPPDAVVIYLTRLPSHGRETAGALRSRKATRGIPIIFVDGAGEALGKTVARVPDAVFATTANLDEVLTRTVRRGVEA